MSSGQEGVSVTLHPKRADWFVVPRAWGPDIAAAPYCELLPDGIGVHRSHLPVLARRYDIVCPLLRQTVADPVGRERFDASVADERRLRPYQHEGREFGLARHGALVADQMRLGKTGEAIAMHDPALGGLLVVAPLATREVWISWMKWRWPDEEPLVLRGRKYDSSILDGKRLIFCHYDVISAWQTLARTRLGMLILDEAHVLSNRRTKRTQAALLLSTRAERVVALTGTPLWNRPAGLWPILACVAPGAWGKYWDFANRYGDPEITPWGTKYNGASNIEEFRDRMSEVMIRRTWKDVAADLPPIERSVEVAEVTEQQAYEIEVMAECVRDYKAKRILAGEVARFRRLLGQLKVAVAVEVAARVLGEEEPVVVWTWHYDVAHEIAKRIAKLGYDAFVGTGRDDQDKRDGTIAQWRGHPQAALVLTIGVGQVGIDLSHARQAVFAEQDFTPATVAQAEMRTFSPIRPMAITYVVVDHDIDRGIVNCLQSKCATADALGVPAAESAVEVIASAFGVRPEDGDISRITEAFLSADLDDLEDDD